MLFLNYRGLSFRDAFSRIGEIRSLVSSHVNVMALTATATRTLRVQVASLLGMTNLVTMIRSPDKANVRYSNIRAKSNNDTIFKHVLKELLEKRTSLPLQWWATHSYVYPNLSIMARKYLCITATSVPSEQLFSTAGNVVSAKRNALLPENVEKLVFLHDNLPSLDLHYRRVHDS